MIKAPKSHSTNRADDAGTMLRVMAFVTEPERSRMRFERLATVCPGVEAVVASSLAEAAADLPYTDVLITIGAQLGADSDEIYRRAQSLKWVQSFGAGVDNIKDHPALPRDVVVTNIRGIHGPQVSEAAFAAMLSFARQLPMLTRNQALAYWEKPAATLLYGKTVGILGLGAIANELALRCQAFGMRVVGISSAPRALANVDEVFSISDIEAAVEEIDYLVVLTPLSTATRHVINRRVLDAMGQTAVLINLSRGGVVDEDAVMAALDAGSIAGAALDVFETEPLPASNRFWTHPKVIVTPHAAGFHEGYADQAFDLIAKNLIRFINGGPAALTNKV